jgi:hypothetical protein
VVQRSDSATGVTVEIVHEALIYGWPTLGSWLEEGQEDRAYLEQIRTAARQWDGKGRPSGLLWRGEAADEARRWHHRYRGRLAPMEEAYLTAVLALAARTTRRKHLLVASALWFLSLLVGAAGVALVLIRNAEQRATQQAIAARAAEERVRHQLDELQEKERQRQEALRLASNATTAASMSHEQLSAANEALRLKSAEAENARQQIHQQLTAMQEKERQRQAAVSLAADASAEAHMSAEQLREVNGQLREALLESELAKHQASALLAEAEDTKRRLKVSLAQAQAAREDAERAREDVERARDVERQRRQRLEKEIGIIGNTLKRQP